MGTEARIVLFAADSATADSAAAAAFQRIADLDAALSDYRVDSEVSRLARHAGGEPQPAGRDLLYVLGRAIDMARTSEGAFDPTAGPLVLLWREARQTARRPDPVQLRHALDITDWQAVAIDTAALTVRLHRAGMRLDLGGIAKGYALDQALAVLRARRVSIALLSLGGEILAGDPPPAEPGWPVRTEDSPAAAVYLARQALSTSGDSEQFVWIDGARYSHVIDPRTGIALTAHATVSVLAPDALTADALATALSVLDSAGRTRLAASFPGVQVLARNMPSS